MPLGAGVRYRVKHTAKGPVRLAFKGNTVVEAKKLAEGPAARRAKRTRLRRLARKLN